MTRSILLSEALSLADYGQGIVRFYSKRMRRVALSYSVSCGKKPRGCRIATRVEPTRKAFITTAPRSGRFGKIGSTNSGIPEAARPQLLPAARRTICYSRHCILGSASIERCPLDSCLFYHSSTVFSKRDQRMACRSSSAPLFKFNLIFKCSR